MGYFEDYLHAASQNELPPSYHRWAAVSLISSAVGRRVWVDQGMFTIYANWYMVLVTDPGEGKSVAKDIAASMLEQVPEIPMTHAAMSKQNLTQLLGAEDTPCRKFVEIDGTKHVYTQLTLFCDEFVDFLKVSEPMQLIMTLTAMYNGSYGGVETKNMGKDYIENPYINLLACATTETMTQLIKEDIISTGFARRCIFIFDPQKTKGVSRPQISKSMKEAYERCVSRLKKISKLKGRFTWEPEAEEYYDKWYEKNHREKQESDKAAEKYFKSTKRTLVLKLAMLLRLARVNELVLTANCIEEAVNWLDEAESYLPGLFSNAGINENALVAQKILEYLSTHGPQKIKKLMATFYKDSRDIEKVITHLRNSGQIIVFPKTEGTGAKQVQVDYAKSAN